MMKTVPELVKRILSAVIAAPVFLFVTWLGGWYFTVGLVLITVVIQVEIISMLSRQELATRKVMAVLLGVPVVLMAVIPQTAWMLFLAVLLLVLVTETFRDHADGWKHLLTTILVAVMIPALISGLIILRDVGDDRTGFILAFTLLVMIWTNDTFAYFGGKSMGKHKLAPKISPAKTVEGFVWGFFGSFLALGLCMHFIPAYPLSLGAALPFAVIAGLFGPAGDLAESKLKRASGIKDSSGLMPGHGGLYDRFDAILFSAPAAAVYFYALIYFELL
jgi:phosphatidate cytidylyltransferase